MVRWSIKLVQEINKELTWPNKKAKIRSAGQVIVSRKEQEEETI